MKIALAYWQNRISPVFDTAGTLLIVTVTRAGECSREVVTIETENTEARAELLHKAGVTVVICGAISRPLEIALIAKGIEVLSHTCGDIEDVVQAFMTGTLADDAYIMPGCCGRRRRQWRLYNQKLRKP